MNTSSVTLWEPPEPPKVPDTLSDPAKIAGSAIQLRERERRQVAQNFLSENYELAATYVWTRAMALLKKQLGSLGPEFIGELLQRPDIDEYSDVSSVVSDSEAISLARDLGIISSTQTMRLLHSQSVVTHFASIGNDPSMDEGEIMTKEEATLCLRVCVQGILGHEQISVAEDFKSFRDKLGSVTLDKNASEFVKLQSSPYFFLKTAIGVLLSLIKSSSGATLEHAARNADLIITGSWSRLRQPEKWQVGQTYAMEFSEGKSETVKALFSILKKVSGFDFVPENLRAAAFTEVASKVIAAHQGMNNFYNEPAPMAELASLGTSIPGPALAKCITAVLCVKLGNFYGTSWAAQAPADFIISGLSKERWVYYLNEKLPTDRLILAKLTDQKPLDNWCELLNKLGVESDDVKDRDVRAILRATSSGDKAKVSSVANRMMGKL